MSKFIQAIVLFVMLSSQYVLAQGVIHHEILAQITPEEHSIKVVDVITLDLANSPVKDSLTFLLHDGDTPIVMGKGFRLEKLPSKRLKQIFPDIKENKTSQNVPVVAYRLHIPNGAKRFTLEYSLNINHAVNSGGEEYERSISASPGLILPEGVYLAGESLWYPRFSNQLVSFRLSVRLPAGWKSVSQGKRIYVEDEKTYHLDTWEETKSQDDIYLIAAKFHEYSQAAGSVDAMAFLREADDALAQKYLDATAQYLEMYRELLGPYPYTKFALVENFWETGFGMPSFTLLGPQIIRFPFILHTSYPHELLHNWWGNSVYVNYDEGNWAEGLTSYLADHLIKEQKGQGGLHRRAVLQKYTNFTQGGGDFPLKEFVSRHNAVTEAVGYGKTLMLFHMLRQNLGDEVFTKGLRQFYMNYRYKVASFSDIETTFSQVSGINLKSFFDAWVKRTGAPDLKLENAAVTKNKNGKYLLSANLIQKQAGEVYDLDVPFAISLKGKTLAQRKVVTMQGRTLSVNLEFDEEPVAIEVDPEFDLFRRLHLNETPPSLSQGFGASDSVIIISSNESPEMTKAYVQLAKSWQSSQEQTISIVYDAGMTKLPESKAIWLLGANNKFKQSFIKTLASYPFVENKNNISIQNNKLNIGNNSIVLVSRNPASPKYAFSFISADKVSAVSGLGRKLPHYGKYSYLGFEGDDPTNIVKGQWPIVNSPLSAHLSKDGVALPLQKREPLISLPPVFSERRMMERINILANKDMQGRGLGTKGLDKAAEYIAAEFKKIGLDSFDVKEGYYQHWSQSISGIGKKVSLKNVIGILPGSNPKYSGESVIVSAHYDHLGMGEINARKENLGRIHYGADDNASGVSIMIELAQLMAKKGNPERTVIFIAFTGEEANRLGSKFYVKNAGKYPVKKIMGAVNLDTVGRLGNNPLTIFSTDSASEWVHIFRGAGFVTGVNVKSVANKIGASDEESFTDVNVPAVHFFSGANVDFHNPSDTADKIDAPGLVKVAAVLKETVDYLAAREEPLTNQLRGASKKNKQDVQSRVNRESQSGRRVSLGTVPDFAYQGAGVKVTDVVKGSAAEKAGIIKGDIIVKINESTINDLRGFSQYLRKLNADDTIKIVLKRGTKVMELDAVVTAR
ncbi:MAG: M20/M25/M40 family metallo-hydrolase [Gammaproteobacteria bacterium]|nr:M20/M25/M40 family metallo-hydrolase [Gammaproteobacteria bacterium]